MKTPCEKIVWDVVPVIKKEYAKMMVSQFNCKQKEAAKKLETTEAAISRYISGKRGALSITDEEILKEIKTSTAKILKDNDVNIISEVCKICRLIRSKNNGEGEFDIC